MEFSEYEWKKNIDNNDITEVSLFKYSWEKTCPFLSKKYIGNSYLHMFDFSEKFILPHWPYCSNIKNLSVWDISSSNNQIFQNSFKLYNSLSDMQGKFNWEGNICNHCYNYFNNKN